MATLKTQYQNYIKDNPDSGLSFIQWFEKVFMPKVESFKKVFGETYGDVNLEDLEDSLISQKEGSIETLEKLEKGIEDLKSKQPQNWIGKWANSILIEILEKKISDLKLKNLK